MKCIGFYIEPVFSNYAKKAIKNFLMTFLLILKKMEGALFAECIFPQFLHKEKVIFFLPIQILLFFLPSQNIFSLLRLWFTSFYFIVSIRQTTRQQ